MRKLLCIIFIFSILIFPCTKANAIEDNIVIENLSIDAVINENGDVSVKETMDCRFLEDVFVFFRNLKKQKCDGYGILNVSTKDSQNNYIEISPGDRHKYNTYSILNSADDTKIEVYSNTNNGKKAFIFQYTIINAAKKVNDLGRLIFDFYDVSINKPVKNFDLKIALKDSKFDSKYSKVKVTSQGDNLTSYKNDDFINFTGHNITSIVGVDLSFQPNYLNATTNDSNVSKSNSSLSFIIIIFLIITSILFPIISIFKNKKSKSEITFYRSNYEFFSGNFLKSPPRDISPAIINFILNKNKKTTYFTIAACILYLCDKGYFSIHKINQNSKLNLKNRVYKDTVYFKKTNKKELPEDNHLKFLLKSINNYSKDGKFTLDTIEQSLKTKLGTYRFKKWFNTFSKLLEKDSIKYIFYKSIGDDLVLTNESLNQRLKWIAYRNFLKTSFLHEKHNLKLFKTYEFIIYALAFELSETYIGLFWNTLSSVENWSNSNIFKDILLRMFIWHHIHIKTNTILKMDLDF